MTRDQRASRLRRLERYLNHAVDQLRRANRVAALLSDDEYMARSSEAAASVDSLAELVSAERNGDVSRHRNAPAGKGGGE